MHRRFVLVAIAVIAGLALAMPAVAGPEQSCREKAEDFSNCPERDSCAQVKVEGPDDVRKTYYPAVGTPYWCDFRVTKFKYYTDGGATVKYCYVYEYLASGYTSGT